MAIDALEPGPDNTYPNLPRNTDGSLNTELMPVGKRRHLDPEGRSVLIDVEPTGPDGRTPSQIVSDSGA